MVICGNPILAPGPDKYAYSNPRVVIEVLSPTTERYDRGDKLLYYQSLPSVQEVLLVAQNQPWVVVHRRSTLPSGTPTWVSIETGEHQWIELSSLEVRLDLDTLYRDKIE